ncbi:MAG: BamA/TamA family outer membrane protein [Cyanobacteriota bacterium]|nr:BamA/TamA family outer membrane protein [Cyanobacteriota bacterium]
MRLLVAIATSLLSCLTLSFSQSARAEFDSSEQGIASELLLGAAKNGQNKEQNKQEKLVFENVRACESLSERRGLTKPHEKRLASSNSCFTSPGQAMLAEADKTPLSIDEIQREPISSPTGELALETPPIESISTENFTAAESQTLPVESISTEYSAGVESEALSIESIPTEHSTEVESEALSIQSTPTESIAEGDREARIGRHRSALLSQWATIQPQLAQNQPPPAPFESEEQPVPRVPQPVLPPPTEERPAPRRPIPTTPQPTSPVPPPPPQIQEQPAPQPPVFRTPQPVTPSQAEEEAAPEPQVLVAELAVDGTDNPELIAEIFRVISTRAGRPTTRTILQEDVNQIFATGFFSNVTVLPEDTPLGVRITFQVEPNPLLERVAVETIPEREGGPVLPQEVVDDIFGEQYGEILNLRRFQAGIIRLNDWYREQGFDLAQVVGAPEVRRDGTVTLVVAEGVIEDIQVRFFNDENEPVDGITRPFIVTREIELKPGDVFNRQTAQQDLERTFGLGIFDDVRFSFSPGSDPSKVIVNVDVNEASTGSIAAGAGISSASGFFGTASYQQQNVGGNNQTFTAEAQLGTREFLFDVSFTDPWIATHPNRLSYTVNAFRRRSISLIFDEGDPDIRLPNGDRPRIVRTGGGITFAQPLSDSPFERGDWLVSAGMEFQGVSIEGDDGRSPRDSLGNLLSFDESGKDNLFFLRFGATQDLRNNPFQPTSGSLLRLALDQTVPVGSGSILMTRARASYSYYIPVEFTNFTEGAEALAFNVQGGTILGDLPPYEAFALGGSNSVRGYSEGNVGSGRSYLQLTAEYRFPLFKIGQFGIGGAAFVDYGTDIGTGDNVPGNPAGVRGKPGSGLGYGLGVRVQSPLGPIRIDYGLNDDGGSRFHFGIGQRF